MVQKIIKPDPQKHPKYVTVTSGMSGYFAVVVWWNKELGGFWEPWQTGHGRYVKASEAAVEAEAWAEADELPYYDAYGPTNQHPTAADPVAGGTQAFIDAILEQASKERQERADKYPTIEDALKIMQECYQRLRDDGWRSIQEPHWPKNEHISTISPGSLEAMETMVSGQHPHYTFMVAHADDWWPARPMLWKPLIKEIQPSKKTL